MFAQRNVSFDFATIKDTSILILFLTLPFYKSFSSVSILILFLISFIEIFKKRSFPELQLNWFLPTLFLYYAVSTFVSDGSWSEFEKYLLLLGLPVLFALNPGFSKEQLRTKIYSGFIIGIIIVFVYCLFFAFKRSIIISDGQWYFNSKVIRDSSYDFLTSSVMGGNYFFGQDFSYFIHPAYFGLYIVFAQYLIYEIYHNTSKGFYKRLLIGCYLIFFIALYLLSSKAAIISSLLLTLFFALSFSASRNVKLALLLLVILSSVAFIFYNPRLSIFKDTFVAGLSINPEARYGHDLRILSWDASFEVIKGHWIMGVGEANKSKALVDVYKLKDYIVPAQEKFNSHNQYLDFLIGGGIVALGIYLCGLISLLVNAIKNRNMPLIAFLIIFSFAALFENLLARHAGVLFFSCFISLLVTAKEPKISTTELGA
jgi:O-antigen ligase